MFGRKKQDVLKDMDIKEKTENKEQIVHYSPQICLFALDKSIIESFKGASYNCSEGSLGRLVHVPNNRRDDKHLLRLNYSSPANLHEHDILVFNMDFYR